MIKQEPLKYGYSALEPYYDAETLRIHYEVLYKGYVDNTNKILQNLEIARNTSDYRNIKSLEKDLSFFGSGAILHKLFFENMTPNRTGISPELEKQINQDFGSVAQMLEQFTEASKTVEASGWCLLVWVPEWNNLQILQCEKHQNLTLWGCKPLLILDMWEHSYFLQYKTKRPEYIQAFWNIVDWQEVSTRFECR